MGTKLPRVPSKWIIWTTYAAIYPLYVVVQYLKDMVDSGFFSNTFLSQLLFYTPLYLPPGMDWPKPDELPADNPAADEYYHRMSDFVDAVPLAVGILAWRFSSDRFVAPWVARLFGVRSQVEPVTPCALLEHHYKTTSWSKVFQAVDGLAKKSGMSERECRTWLTKRRAMDKPTPAFRLSESIFKFSHFSVTVSLCVLSMIIHEPRLFFTPCSDHSCGIFVKEPFHWDFRLLIQWQLAFYYSSFYTHFFYDVRRSDFAILTAHHFCAFTGTAISKILWMSAKSNVAYILTDTTDLIMELAKIFVYIRYKTAAEITLLVFTGTWMVLRVLMAPYYTITYVLDCYSALDGALSPAVSLAIGLIWVLLGMIIYWTRLILITVYRSFVLRDAKGDVRSDDEE